MFFTQDDYKKIKQYLEQNAKMDTDFSELSENDIVIQDDIVAIVHNGQNYKIPISTLSKVVLSDALSDIVKDVQYNPDTKKITKNIGDETIDVVSASQIVAEGIGETSKSAYRGDRGKIAYEHSQSQHARVDATKVEASTTNGYIKIDGVETKVYEHPPVAGASEGEETIITKESIGLGNVTNDAQVKRSEMGVSNGVATLDEDGYIPNTQINPSLRKYKIKVISENEYETLGSYEQDVLYFVYEEEDDEIVSWGFGDGFPIILSDNSTFPIILS